MTNEAIKTLADGYYAGNAHWLNKEQEQDTKVGWRQGFAYALRQFAVSGCVPFQKCPVCDGEGRVRPSENKYATTPMYMPCDVCKGAKIIRMAHSH